MNPSRRVVKVRIAAGAAGLGLALAGCSATNPPDVLKVSDPGDGRSGQIGGQDANTTVKLRNFLVVSDGNGKPGTVVGAVSNRTGSPVQLSLAVVQPGQGGQQSPLGTANIAVKPGEFVQFGDPAGGTGGTATPTGAATSSPATSPAASIGSDTTYTPTPGDSASRPADIGSEPATGLVTNFRLASVPLPAGAILQLVARTGDGGTTIDLPILPPVGEYAYLSPSAAVSPTPSATSSPSVSGSPARRSTRRGPATRAPRRPPPPDGPTP